MTKNPAESLGELDPAVTAAMYQREVVLAFGAWTAQTDEYRDEVREHTKDYTYEQILEGLGLIFDLMGIELQFQPPKSTRDSDLKIGNYL
jgi:hypothetical protein